MSGEIDLRSYIRPGDTVLIGEATAEPRSLVERLIEQRHQLAPLRVFVGVSFTGLLKPEHADAFEYLSFGGVGRTADLARAAVLSIMPIHIGTVPQLIASGRLRIDVVLAQVAPANAEGDHSLGLVADYLQAAIAAARVTLAEVNPRVPFTLGDTLVPSNRIAATVRDDRPLVAVERRPPLPEDEAIGRLVAGLIPDGATLQFGVGGTPDAVLAHLRGKRELGIHSGLVSDAVVELVESGVVTNARKEIDAGVTVAGALFGTERLYRWADRNPRLALRALSYTHEARVLSAFGSFFALNSAIEVDLTGQINAELAGSEHIGTVGGQGAFARAALTSAAGRSIVALPATARGGTVSRIVPWLTVGITTTPRADADLVVTEHGIADLRGATLTERAQRLITVADPRYRDGLLRFVASSHGHRESPR
jgi:acetyl-CoA hydrolase